MDNMNYSSVAGNAKYIGERLSWRAFQPVDKVVEFAITVRKGV